MWILIVLIVGGLIFIGNRSKDSLHIVQLEGYETDNYKKWVANNKKRAYSYKKNTEPIKKALVFTDRAKRLFIANLAISFIFMSIVLVFFIILPNLSLIHI